MSLTFNGQKNAVHGKFIWNGLSGNTRACAVRRVLSHARYLHTNGTPPTTLFCSIYTTTSWNSIRIANISAPLHSACDNVGDILGITGRNISAQSL